MPVQVPCVQVKRVQAELGVSSMHTGHSCALAPGSGGSSTGSLRSLGWRGVRSAAPAGLIQALRLETLLVLACMSAAVKLSPSSLHNTLLVLWPAQGRPCWVLGGHTYVQGDHRHCSLPCTRPPLLGPWGAHLCAGGPQALQPARCA